MLAVLVLTSEMTEKEKRQASIPVLYTCQFHLRTEYEGPEGEYRYSYNHSLTSALDVDGGVQHHSPAVLPQVKKIGTRCTGGWWFPRPGLERVQKISPPSGFGPRTLQHVVNRST
jgi:hypothetical protein